MAQLDETISSGQVGHLGDHQQLHQKSNYMFDVEDFGAVGDGTTDDSAAIQAAIDAAEAAGGGIVFVPSASSDYRCLSDITIATSEVELRGADTGNSWLAFEGAGLILDAVTPAATIHRNKLTNLRISRTGTAGAAVLLDGLSAGGVTRWNFTNLRISASTGTGLKIIASWVGVLIHPIIQGCAIAIEVVADAGNTSGNNITVFGGELQGNSVAVEMENVSGFCFYGTGIEGNTVSGVELKDICRNVTFASCYFESNEAWDIKVGTTANEGYGLTVRDSVFWAKAAATYAIELQRMKGAKIDSCTFINYATAGINNNDQGTLDIDLTNSIIRGTTPLLIAGSGSTSLYTGLINDNTHRLRRLTTAGLPTPDTTNQGSLVYDATLATPVFSNNSSWIRLGLYRGSGSPEGAVTAPVGELFQRSDGGAGTTLYVKESGTGNTGWVAK